MSIESRLKMSLAKKGKPGNKGYKHTEATKMKLSIAHKGKPGRRLSEENRLKLIAANTGRKISEETRLKMSLAKKGKLPAGYHKIKLLPPWNRGLKAGTDERVRRSISVLHAAPKPPPWNKGTKIDTEKYPNFGHREKHSGQSISKMKMARKGKSAHWNKGEKSPMWKGGVTPEHKKIRASIEFSTWREDIFTRDNWTCQKYKIRGGKLHPHHILNFCEYPELRFDVENGITLSKKAHIEFHKIYGKSGNTREQLMEFLNG